MHSSSDPAARRSFRWGTIPNSCWKTLYSILCLDHRMACLLLVKRLKVTRIQTLLWAILLRLPRPHLEEAKHSWLMPGHCTLRVLFCQSVAHDEPKDRGYDWAIASWTSLQQIRVLINSQFSSVPELEAIDSISGEGIALEHSMISKVQKTEPLFYSAIWCEESELVRANDQGR
jgi:hypothetical protein